jgi:hypothetical protein
MKASFVAYDFRELHKKSELKIVNYGHTKYCLKIARNSNLVT